MRVIGIDCATDDSKVGVAIGTIASGILTADVVQVCARDRPASRTVCDWIRSSAGPVLLALDAPLGWPDAMKSALRTHLAGQEITADRNAMFRRATDLSIQQELRKKPLDVGADRIARTAHSALCLLGAVRRELGVTIPLAWSPNDLPAISAIEVYPAATLVAHGLRSTGYKKREHGEARRNLVASLREKGARLESCEHEMERNANALDAVICLVAAADFLAGSSRPPDDPARATREGWIWAARPAPAHHL